MQSVSSVAQRSQPLSWLQPAVLTGSLLPFGWLALSAALGKLGANPIETALNQLGLLALIFLWSCLACTPLKILLGWTWPIRLRKTLGLLAFSSALTHFLTYLALDQGLKLGKVLADVAKRPFIAVGFIALLLLVPLALTSTKKALQRLGFKRWKRLHRLIYVVAILATVHFILRVKSHRGEPVVYAAILAVLLLVRIASAVRDKVRESARRGRHA
ncbi:MAG TPA: protein-methionine-sulfoxide reductase heme-binding subunit MsrQ [Polyangiaceae bacterium]|nr:protein-methionine-sulfoxide reductase heme-binding subunit MsrQ [Polyangiaceae bacterium]